VRRRGLKNLALLTVREFAPLVRALQPIGAKPEVLPTVAWDEEYQSGKWRRLGDLREEAHHLAIAVYVNGLGRNGNILDVGCGEGALNVALRKFGYGRYVGIDISNVAVAAAQRHADETTAFQVISGDEYQTPDRFDTIIFDETLSYFANPAETIERFSGFLSEGGILVISMAMVGMRDGLLKLNLWLDIEADLKVLDETTIYRPDGITWIVKALTKQ
jgi:2-polyprenyl-3-methyl-5-hydroxy-6-metoxy-1,4-benzoquinol methylase